MLISHKWLQKYIPDLNSQSPEEIAEQLTKSLAEVERIIPVRQELQKIVVGEVIRVEKHTNSEKLSICHVTIDGTDKMQIICGAPNVTEKSKVAVCLPGGRVYGENNETIEIKTATIRGVESSGMLCSPRELGLSDEHTGILILESNIALGTDLTELLKDQVYEIENKSISHRSDCFSHKGIAREIAAVLSLDFFNNEENLSSLIPTEEGKSIDIEINVDEDFLKRFSALLINNIEIKSSPLWMQARLSAVGERSINNVVDITNYIMLDQGQPLHAYDYDKLDKNRLVVRKAKMSEKVKTLDGNTRELDKDMVVITDGTTIEDIAGIMGGDKSQITSTTTSILLEAATWDMYNIRRTSRKLGHRTEASTRFEKGLDPNMTISVLQSALTLISDLAGGELGVDPFDHYPNPDMTKTVELDINLVNRMLSLSLSKYEIVEILEKLYITEEEESGGSNPNNEIQNTVLFSIPTYRRDLNIKEDLIEEVARIYGFENLTPKVPVAEMLPANSYNPSRLFRILSTNLAGLGLYEVKTYSFVGEKDYENAKLSAKNTVRISNPIAPDLNLVRSSLLPSLLGTTAKNQPEHMDFGLFEISRVVHKELDKENLHKQPWTLGVVMNLKEDVNEPFNSIKGILENLSRQLNLEFAYTAGIKTHTKEAFHPYQSATILLDKKPIGVIGVAHPEVVFNFDLRGRIVMLEISLDELIPLVDRQPYYIQLANFPEVERDVSFWIPDNVVYQDIKDSISHLDLPLLKELRVKDVYREQKSNKHSITLTLLFQSHSKTLTDEEVTKLVKYITGELEAKLKIDLRD